MALIAAYLRAWAGGDPVAGGDGAPTLDLADGPALDHVADLVECAPLSAAVVGTLRRLAGTSRERAVVELLGARSAEGAGRAAEAAALVTAALRHDPELPPAVLDAADYAATRGDAVAAEGFLKRAGLPADDPRRRALAAVVTAPASPIARAQPCPCGSRRKYRWCCLRFAVHPLPQRATLVYARLAAWAHRAPRRGTVTWLESFVDPAKRSAALLPIDLAIFDTGIVDDYLAARAALLRADERRLVEVWRRARISAYEVGEVRPGSGVTLVPLRGEGERVRLAGRALAASLRPRDLLVARVLHDGDRECLIVPPVRVPRDRSAELRAVFAAYTPQALAAFFGSS